MGERGPYAKGIQRRAEISQATLRVFSQVGYRKSSLQEIARQLEIGPTLLRHYFSSREELLTEVIKEWDAENERRGRGLTHFEDWLKAIRHNSSIPGLVRLYTAFAVEATDPDHPARPYFKQRYALLTDEIVQDIRNQQRLGHVPADCDPERIARILIAACEGLQIRWLHEPTFDMRDEFVFLLDQFHIRTEANSGHEVQSADRMPEIS